MKYTEEEWSKLNNGNSHQTSLFGENELMVKFRKYHSDNPHIWEAFEKYTLQAISRGHTKLSAEFIINVIRWETKIYAKEDYFKINNNYKSFYSRMFLQKYPTYKNLFNVRDSFANQLNTNNL